MTVKPPDPMSRKEQPTLRSQQATTLRKIERRIANVFQYLIRQHNIRTIIIQRHSKIFIQMYIRRPIIRQVHADIGFDNVLNKRTIRHTPATQVDNGLVAQIE
ncbi:hypothetical protein Pan189_01200 [Stratiformator vulcanicus]|uniref:Uncharacterized protein n=1 Tax=Stratiformator vulcanicus TaxID=2527980 RepID=A0A517QW11_9PLAN|nr:hypothetical protein Pan189_01200 [Stratiformator vulcanicus]